MRASDRPCRPTSDGRRTGRGYSACRGARPRSHRGRATRLEDACRRAAPAGVQQRDGPSVPRREVDGHAVRHGDGEQQTSLHRGVAVGGVGHVPAGRNVLVPEDGRPVNLVGLLQGVERGPKRVAEGAPPAHHRADRFSGPEPEREAVACPAFGDPGDEAEPLPPLDQLGARHGATRERHLLRGYAPGGLRAGANRAARSARPGPSAVRGCSRSRARSARRC